MTILARKALSLPGDGIEGKHVMQCPVCGTCFDMRETAGPLRSFTTKDRFGHVAVIE